MAQLGNTNSTKNRRWAQAIDKALKQYHEGDVKAGEALDKIAMRLVGRAITGDSTEFREAVKEIGDRIDGKALAEVKFTGEIDITGLPDKDLDNMIEELHGDIARPEATTH